MTAFKIPDAPRSIQKGVPLKSVLGRDAIEQMATNFAMVDSRFDKKGFVQESLDGLEPLGIKDRANHIASAMRTYLPSSFKEAAHLIESCLSPELERTEDNGLAPMFYMPHCAYVHDYGTEKQNFETSIQLQYELTKRFTCEFSIRPFIQLYEEETLAVMYEWMKDPNPHIRRLCSEGTRPRLPWASKIDSFVADPSPVIPILEYLKDDEDLYVRRSVANHVGDIAKDHINTAMDLCESWLNGASKERKWVIRHAVRNPFKKGNTRAIELRKLAK